MGTGAWLAVLACVVAGGSATLLWARRMGVVVPAVAGLSLQGLITVGLYGSLGLWAPDAIVYDRIGQEFAAHWRGGPLPSAVTDGKEAFPLMLGAVSFALGHAAAIGLAINWVAHGLLIVMMAALARRIDLPVRATAWVAALVPPALFWSALLLRESITWLLMAAFVYALIGVSRRLNVVDALLMVGALGALLWFRGTAAIVLAAVGMFAMVLTANRRTLLPRLGVVAVALVVVAPRLKGLLAGYGTIDAIEETRAILAGTAETSFDDFSSGGALGGRGVVASLADSALRVAFGPYPWEWPALGVPLAVDAIVWLSVLGLAGLGWWRAPKRKELLLLVLPALALSGALMVTSGNYGTMQRLRFQTTVLLIPLASLGLLFVASETKKHLRSRTRRADAVGHDPS